MTLKPILAAVVLLASTLANSAYATPWSLSVQGTIEWGTDYAGVFGQPGQELRGLKYTQTVTVETDPALYLGTLEPGDTGHYYTNYSAAVYGTIYGDLSHAVFRETVTVNGITLSVDLTHYLQGAQEIYRGATVKEDPFLTYNAFISSIEGATADGYRSGSTIRVGSYDATIFPIASLDFSQQAAGDLPATTGFQQFSEFGLGGDNNPIVYLYATPERFSLNGGSLAADVPEPASLALLGLGLAGLAVLRNGRKPTR